MSVDISTLNLKNKRVLVRTDFNVTLDHNFVPLDTFRIQQTIPTIKKIIESNGKAIIISHIGRPKGKYEQQYSLKYLVPTIKALTDTNVLFINDCIGTEVKNAINKASNGDIILLENVRFYPEEEQGNYSFAQKLSELGDIYINEGFSVSHRNHSSIAITPSFFNDNTKALGYLSKSELVALNNVLNIHNGPITAIVGGSKVSTKIPVLNNLAKRVNNLVIGGAMAFSFLKALNYNIGNSFFEPDCLDICINIFNEAKANDTNVFLPTDIVAASSINNSEKLAFYDIDQFPNNLQGLDIGKKTVNEFIEVINRSKTILWNGPMGVFEKKEFSQGTFLIGEAISKKENKECYSLVGGGDTVSAINMLKIDKNFSHISTAGGAMLDFLAGKELPGIKAITDS